MAQWFKFLALRLSNSKFEEQLRDIIKADILVKFFQPPLTAALMKKIQPFKKAGSFLEQWEKCHHVKCNNRNRE